MKKNFKLLLLLPLFALLFVGLIGCTSTYQNPNLTNPDATYLKLGDYKITNNQLYRRLMVTNGLDVINDWMDAILLSDTPIDQAEFEEFKNKTIYGVEDLDDFDGDDDDKAEKLTEFKNDMKVSGYYSDDEIEDYLKLQYRRNKYARTELEKDIQEYNDDPDNEEDYFTESEIENYYNTTYVQNNQTVTAIILTFNSDAEARAMMNKYGIDTTRISPAGWFLEVEDANERKGKVQQAFIDMFNENYAYFGTSPIIGTDDYTVNADKTITFDLDNDINENAKFVFTYQDLIKISSTIASRVFNTLDEKDFHKSYTTAPVTYLNNFYLALKIEKSEIEELSEVTDEIIDELIEKELTSTVVNRYLYELRGNTGIKIYDKAVESAFKQNYDTAFKNANVTNYTEYARNKEENATTVVTFKANNTTHSLTADDMFEKLAYRYGVQTAVGYIDQYIVLGNDTFNKIYNPFSGKIHNQKKYDEYYQSEIQSLKDALEAGTYSTLGFNKKYGWENFMRDYLGVLTEAEILASSNLYNVVLAEYKKSLYTYGEVSTENEDTIWYQMNKIYEDYFGATVFTVSVYLDYDLNTVADDMEGNWSPDILNLANQLFAKVFEKAEESEKTGLNEKVAEVITQYKVASHDDPTWGVFKQAGLHLTSTSKSTYTSASTLNEDLKAKIKDLWLEIKEAGNLGDTLDTEEKPAVISDPIFTNTGRTKVVVLATTKPVEVSSSMTIPTQELIDRYIITQKPIEEKTDAELKIRLTSAEQKAINTYYLPALQVLEANDRVQLSLIDKREDLMEAGTVKFENASDETRYNDLIVIIRAKFETEEE